jgi:DinB superfamily
MWAMHRSEQLAAEFERVNRELVDYLRGLDARQWLTPGVNSPIMQLGDEDEHRPVGTIAHHVATAHQRVVANLRSIAAGQPVARPQPGSAARHAAEHAEPDQAETIAMLEEWGARVAAAIRELTDEELDREVTTMVGTTSLETFIKRGVIFHPVWHLSSIRATFEPAAPAS